MARIEELRRNFERAANFVIVYIKEAHPDDEWQTGSNREAGVVFKQPTTFAQRRELAQTFVAKMEVKTPVLIDDIRNTAGICYAAWPERIYVIDPQGVIVYKGGMGPMDFNPDELEGFLKENYGKRSL